MSKNTRIASYWQQDAAALTVSLQFSDFSETFAFMTEVALLAERQQHHPDWRNIYNRLDISLSTHDTQGLSDRDFKLAAAIDTLISRYTPVI